MTMTRRVTYGVALCWLLVAFTLPAIAQESAVRGSIVGVVMDPSGAVIPSATVTITGPTGTRTQATAGDGRFNFGVLTPGMYTVKVEKEGFKTAQLGNVEVATGRTSSLRLDMETGQVSETVEVSGSAITVDTSSSAVSTNLADTFYEKIPIQRGVANLFYAAPGVAGGGASGVANPSISGGSGLENQYIADGVNITDTAFGGLGVFSRSYGSLASGINLTFVKEVQVKTAGYEPQYGRSTGGIVQIVTKSGSNEFHGALGVFASPKGLETRRLNADDPRFGRANLQGRLLHVGGYDASGEIGGYVPGLRNHLFFFGSYNPSIQQRFLLAPVNSGLFQHGEFDMRTVANSYAAKLTFKLGDNYTLEGSIFGDPSHTSTGPNRRLAVDNSSSFSKLEFGTRNMALRLNSTLSPSWLVNISATWGHTKFDETGFPNLNQITDETQTDNPGFGPGCDPTNGCLPNALVQRGLFVPAGLGFVEPTISDSYGVTVDTQKVVHKFGEHTFYVGYHMDRPFYDGQRSNSGPPFIIPATNMSGNTTDLTGVADVFNTPANANWRLRLAPPGCTLCPLMNVPGFATPQPVDLQLTRSEFGLTGGNFKAFHTSGRYHAFYGNDTWAINKYITVNVGLRWEQQRLTGEATHYTFTDNWSPRIGFAIDPIGDRKTKIFGNFGRYAYGIPLDLAERSLTNELDLFGLRVAPDFTIDASGNRVVRLNEFGTVTPIVDPAHTLNGATGGIDAALTHSFESTEAISPGTKMSYLDEYVAGIEHEFPKNVVISAKYVKRDLKRIVEDTGGISPEAALAGVSQVFNIGNVNAGTDLFTNPIEHVFPTGGTPPSVCDPNTVIDPVTDTFGNTLGAACFEANGANGQPAGSAIPDGIPDGFVNARRAYWAVEFEANKAFSAGWMMRVNYRYARLFGNFEGALRNDNGQTDPSISSLFDFTAGQFNLLGDQFKPGPLNTDRKHILNTYFSYAFDHTALKGLALGFGSRVQTGIPINDLKAHPVYENAGEVPVGGRGILGRTPTTTQFDVHADYTINTSDKTRLVIGTDLFNIFNRRTQLLVDQNEDVAFGTPNTDFRKPVNQAGSINLGDAFLQPFNARVMAKFVF